MNARKVTTALACAGAVLAGCGEKKEITSTPTPPPAETTETPSTSPGQSETEPESQPPPKATTSEKPPRERSSPEDQQGGAGDEIPARSQAMITGRRGRLSPRLVRVPPFIAVRVELRSADGGRYRLSGAGKTVRAGPRVSAMAATFDGLRPGRRLVLTGTGGRVVVEASAEPGP